MARARVVIDGRCLGARPTGVARWTGNLFCGLSRLDAAGRMDWVVLRDPKAEWPEAVAEGVAGLGADVLEVAGAFHSPKGWPSVVRAVEGVGGDWLLTPDAFSPVWGRFQRATVIHDAIPVTQAAHLRGSKKSRIPGLWRGWLWMQGLRADRVLTVSRHSARTLARVAGVRGSKLAVVGNAVAPPEGVGVRRAEQEPAWLLYVGRRDPYKNVPMLVRVVHELRERGVAARLAVVGPADPRYPEAEQEAQRLGLGADAVCFAGGVSEDELEAWYARASAVVLPSLEEGFGLPAVEAMARGVAVACATGSGLAEAVGSAAVTIDPRDQGAWVEGLAPLLGDAGLRARLAEAGRGRAARFTPERQARRVLRALGLG